MFELCVVWQEYFTILLQNAYLPTMPEDTLPEAKRVLGGRFYGKYFFLVHQWQNITSEDHWFIYDRCHVVLYSRVSKGPPLHGGRCKCFQNLLVNLWVQTFFMWYCTVWGSSCAAHVQCVWSYHWRSQLQTGTRQQRSENVSCGWRWIESSA